MHILIAPNAFKNSLTAEEAASAIEEGLKQTKLDCTCECFPIGDGGDGTGELIISKCKGKIIQSNVHDALGRNITATFGLIDNEKTAVIEMANASGLRLLKPGELNPLIATSFGTGEQMKLALDRSVNKIILGIGGSATVDGGVGMLKALGVRFLDAERSEVKNLPGNLTELESIDISKLDKRILECEVSVLCDVNNLLLGNNGAAAVFGPQKGATPSDVKKLDAALAKFAQVILKQTGKDVASIKSGGAAGGAAAGLFGMLNAKLVSGIDYFLALTGFDSSLKNSDVVITGEGSIDEQTLQGKGPFGVAAAAKRYGLPVIGLAGNVPKEPSKNLQKYFDALLSINTQPFSLEKALKNARENLIRTASQLEKIIRRLK
jgi:glycerate kinase